MGPFENPLEIENCKHKFCFDCFNSYLDNLIKRNNIEKIPCPKNKCTNDNPNAGQIFNTGAMFLSVDEIQAINHLLMLDMDNSTFI